MRSGVVVQARLGSHRLPRKVLLDLGGRPLLGHVLRAMREMPAAAHVVATDAASASELRPLVQQSGFELFVGAGTDVLSRYARAAVHFRLDQIVRATGDAPLVSAPLAESILNLHLRKKADLSHYLGCPLGTGVEVINAAALAVADQEAADPLEREHLTTFLYRERARFTVLEPTCPPDAYFLGANVTVDTPDDMQRLRAIVAAHDPSRPIAVQPLVSWLRAHPDYAYGSHPHLSIHTAG